MQILGYSTAGLTGRITSRACPSSVRPVREPLARNL